MTMRDVIRQALDDDALRNGGARDAVPPVLLGQGEYARGYWPRPGLGARWWRMFALVAASVIGAVILCMLIM